MTRRTLMPGSEEARERGCKCELVVPNWMGLGSLVRYNPECPMHADEALRPKPKRKAKATARRKP